MSSFCTQNVWSNESVCVEKGVGYSSLRILEKYAFDLYWVLLTSGSHLSPMTMISSTYRLYRHIFWIESSTRLSIYQPAMDLKDYPELSHQSVENAHHWKWISHLQYICLNTNIGTRRHQIYMHHTLSVHNNNDKSLRVFTGNGNEMLFSEI